MKRNIFSVFSCGLLSLGIALAFTSCKNGDVSFPDYEGGTTVYFPYQYPVRTIVLGDDEYDTTLDKAHQCQIKATFGGSYNGSNGSVQVEIDERLCENLFFEDGVTPVKPMKREFYTLSTTNLEFNGTMNGSTTVQLTDAFFNDADAVKNTWVIPLVIVSQSGFSRILTGSYNEGMSGSRTDESVWDVKPMDYVLYCVKFQNKYSGYWLTNGNTSTDNIEQASSVQIRTTSMNGASYTVSFKEGNVIYNADLILTFDGSDNCTIKLGGATKIVEKEVIKIEGGSADGNGNFQDDGAKKAWGDKDRDRMELNYNVTLEGHTWSVHEVLIWQRSGVSLEEFAPVYVK